MATGRTPRGIRNNNPLNIRIGNDWIGEVDNNTDGVFEQFKNMIFGIRAGFIILRKYINKYGRNTIAKIIQAWAPSHENHTLTYIQYVSTIARVDKDATIKYTDEMTMRRIVLAMIEFECGIHAVQEWEQETEASMEKYVSMAYDCAINQNSYIAF